MISLCGWVQYVTYVINMYIISIILKIVGSGVSVTNTNQDSYKYKIRIPSQPIGPCNRMAPAHEALSRAAKEKLVLKNEIFL